MSKTWYYRLLFSYMPVFFLMISFLFFIFFQMLTERAQQDTAHIYASVNNQIVQSVEQPLQSIDHMMVTIQTRSSNSSEFNMLDYFDQEGPPSVFFTFQMTKEFNNMRQLYQSIHSIYLVRERDGYVLSSNTVSPMEQFSDRAFIEELQRDNYSYHWTNERRFKEFQASREEPVVSLARKYLTSRGESGLMIINVRTSSLEGLVSQKMDQTTSYVTITGKDHEPIFATEKVEAASRRAISTVVSDYTGWTYESGLEKGSGFTILQTFSNVWIMLAVIVAILGLLSIVYMTHRNYRPLRALISKLDKISQASGEQSEAERNEFHYIESTVDSLVQRFNLFKSQSDLNSGYRKKSIFLEVMSGSRSLAAAEWDTEMERHGFAGSFSKAVVIVISIDKYSDVLSRYREQDMILFRFIIQNMYMELIQKYSLSSWSEWMNDKEMCGFVYVQEEHAELLMDNLLKLSESAHQWIRSNLPFTVTIGIGQMTDSVAQLKTSYKKAMEAVNFRLVFGNNRTIGYWDTETGATFELYNQLEQIRSLIYAFRLMEPEWRLKYGSLFEQFRQNKLKREDMVNLLNYFVFYLFEHVQGTILNDEMIETNKAIMKDVIDQFETLEDVQEEILGVMEKLEYALEQKTGKGGGAEIAVKMKQYIDENVSNPDLSLIHLSQQFDIPSKNVSSLFKEQFDIKFIDFLIHRRVELAKQLLQEKDLSVQEIGRAVGYLNPVSFNRVFKRVVGMPPGDYRKEKLG
ncbi:helix-turn-helix domain-containing protein [Paenibacillus luteus]|uniref:helix-turn-helix domain-containing protein n=1 Tax=Paenibacillus luteus TaxID=2545753 RepID=UPI001375BBFB|nr:helix-turn-helix domain-containing protein [Paenibacillus luteus]